MPGQIRYSHLLLATEGTALLRNLISADEAWRDRRVAEMAAVVAGAADPPMSLGLEAPELNPREGYARWSETYDNPGNPLIDIEQPLVWAILDGVAGRGRAVDAACGTGRHTARLVGLGHDTIGVDASPEMLSMAAARCAGAARLLRGDLRRLPLGTGVADLAVCSLALTHVVELDRAIAELARVVRPGGVVVLSDIHPSSVALIGQGFFTAADGSAGWVRNLHHPHGDYLRAFAAAGLEVVDCLEPVQTADVAVQGLAGQFSPEAAAAALVDIPLALIWHLRRT